MVRKSLEAAGSLAEAISSATTNVLGPAQIRKSVNDLWASLDDLKSMMIAEGQSTEDQLWKHLEAFFRANMPAKGFDAVSTHEYNEWLTRMFRLWCTIAHVRNFLLCWAGLSESVHHHIKPDESLVTVRTADVATLLQPAILERIRLIGNGAAAQISLNTGMNIERWEIDQYKRHLHIRGHGGRVRLLHHRDDPNAVVGFYSWKKSPVPPADIHPEVWKAYDHEFVSRPVWPEVLSVERCAWDDIKSDDVHTGKPETPVRIYDTEAALAVAYDILKQSTEHQKPFMIETV